MMQSVLVGMRRFPLRRSLRRDTGIFKTPDGRSRGCRPSSRGGSGERHCAPAVVWAIIEGNRLRSRSLSCRSRGGRRTAAGDGRAVKVPTSMQRAWKPGLGWAGLVVVTAALSFSALEPGRWAWVPPALAQASEALPPAVSPPADSAPADSGAERSSPRQPAEGTPAEELEEDSPPADPHLSSRKVPEALLSPGGERIEKDRTRTDYDQSCLRSGCHGQFTTRAWVHAPTGVKDCGVCHEAVGAAASHAFRLTREKQKLCVFCHELPAPQAVVHKAYQDFDCLGCHDPHGGATRALLTTMDQVKLCAGECHDPLRREAADGGLAAAPYRFVHDPVTRGECLECHSPHQSAYEALLEKPERETCLSCHSEVEKTLIAAGHIHEPVSSECRSCHLAHAGDEPRLLREKPVPLCLGCHETIAEAVRKGPQFHASSTGDYYCIACHAPHAGQSRGLVRSPVAPGCFHCHDEEIVLDSGRRIADIRRQLERSKSKHGAGVQGKCQACHRGHSSPYRALLTTRYPNSEYVEFTTDAYALCFACHDSRIVTEERTALTGFRDRDKNLHYVHVHRRKGRSCSLCHAAHGSEFPKLVQRTVPFGRQDWKLPIGFEETARGGTCLPGCHKQLSYDNRNPPPSPEGGGAALLPAARTLEPEGSPQEQAEGPPAE